MQVLTKLLGAKAHGQIRRRGRHPLREDLQDGSRHLGQPETGPAGRQAGVAAVGCGRGAVWKSAPAARRSWNRRVRDWGWTTLENQVANTVAAAATMATGPNPVSATTSFEQTYSEDTVIDWSTPVSSFMRKFSSEEWNKLFIKVDNRKLSVLFNLIGQLTRTDTGDAVARSVTVTVDYPTRTTGNTFVLIVSDGDQSSMIYEAPGDFPGGSYNAEFTYSYVIQFKDGTSFRAIPSPPPLR
ncbi:MAG: hypothetical protein HPM95_00525 [Alphaproteobacteria bacterium]|nr:hypothetical protein [Alphaproteobacteria bacterium]